MEGSKFSTLMKTLPLKFRKFHRRQIPSAVKKPAKSDIEFHENIKFKTIKLFSNEEINGEIQKFFLRKRTYLKLKFLKNLLVNAVELIVH